jgi:hypothetical protein
MTYLNHPVDTTKWKKIGGQLGSNPAGIYQDQHGAKYYVKSLESPMHARNEWLAAQLYKLVNAPTLVYLPSLDTCQVITCWQSLDKTNSCHFSPSQRELAQQWFAVHCWTANWDAAGYHGDNQGVVKDKVLTLDVGGALNYRAHGDPKGKAFGTQVNEIDSMRRDPDNPHAIKLYGDMSDDEVKRSIKNVTKLSDQQIAVTILTNGGSAKLADKMIARKQDLMTRLSEQTSD